MEGASFFAGPLLDFLPAFFAEFGSNGITYFLIFTQNKTKYHLLSY